MLMLAWPSRSCTAFGWMPACRARSPNRGVDRAGGLPATHAGAPHRRNRGQTAQGAALCRLRGKTPDRCQSSPGPSAAARPLAVAMFPECGHGAAVECDRAPALGHLGCAELGLVFDRDHGLPNRSAASIEIKIRPAQTQCLAASHAGCRQQKIRTPIPDSQRRADVRSDPSWGQRSCERRETFRTSLL